MHENEQEKIDKRRREQNDQKYKSQRKIWRPPKSFYTSKSKTAARIMKISPYETEKSTETSDFVNNLGAYTSDQVLADLTVEEINAICQVDENNSNFIVGIPKIWIKVNMNIDFSEFRENI